MTNDENARHPSPVAQGGALEDDELLRLVRKSGFDGNQYDALVMTRWKDGIDVDYPTSALKEFAKLLLARHPVPQVDADVQVHHSDIAELNPVLELRHSSTASGLVAIERAAQLIAHRACCGSEDDPANGKLHGYCVVCGVPWPCEYAGKPPARHPSHPTGPDWKPIESAPKDEAYIGAHFDHTGIREVRLCFGDWSKVLTHCMRLPAPPKPTAPNGGGL
jgi:hypothetical protein